MPINFYEGLLGVNGSTLMSLCMISLIGDCLCYGRPNAIYVISNRYVRAIVDNFTHGLISMLATKLFFGWKRSSLLLLAYVIGSFVDIDHFISIGSVSLSRVLNTPVQRRPFFHNSLYMLILTGIIISLESIVKSCKGYAYSFVFFLAWSTHHIRDGQRRGLTFSPLGQTSPIDYYIPITCFFLVIFKLMQTILCTRVVHSCSQA
jgi:hypothetical protein